MNFFSWRYSLDQRLPKNESLVEHSTHCMAKISCPFNCGRESVEAAVSAMSEIVHGKEFGIVNGKNGHVKYHKGSIGRTTTSGKTKGGFGFLHIVSARMAKDNQSLEQAVDTAIMVGMAVASGTETDRKGNQIHYDLGPIRAIVGKSDNGDFVITGYEIKEEGVPLTNPPSGTPLSRPAAREDEIVAMLSTRIAYFSSMVKDSKKE